MLPLGFVVWLFIVLAVLAGLPAQDVIGGFLCLGGGYDCQLPIPPKGLNPRLEVGGAVLDGRVLNSGMTAQESGGHFGYSPAPISRAVTWLSMV